ncbi:MAG: phage scaffolding protein, partial [Ruthenibacterium sp.]
YGMSEDDIAKILQEEKTKRAARLPPEQQQMLKTQLAKASSMLLSADVKALGAEMGLLDAPAALLLMQKDGIKIEEDGTVSGTKEALETLKKEKPYLFGAAGAWADKHGEPSTALTGVEAAFAKLNPDLKL